jgi:hypothetical protein
LICDILVRIRMQIRILGSLTLTKMVPAPDPALFISVLQDANEKKVFTLIPF